MIALHRHTSLAPCSTALPVQQMLNAAAGQLARWIDPHRQRRALLALEDHLLKDVGLGRADAYREGSKHFWEE